MVWACRALLWLLGLTLGSNLDDESGAISSILLPSPLQAQQASALEACHLMHCPARTRPHRVQPATAMHHPPAHPQLCPNREHHLLASAVQAASVGA